MSYFHCLICIRFSCLNTPIDGVQHKDEMLIANVTAADKKLLRRQANCLQSASPHEQTVHN